MPILKFECLVLTAGAAPRAALGQDGPFRWRQLPEVVPPAPGAELFGPYVDTALRELPKCRAAFLFQAEREVTSDPEGFFEEAVGALVEATAGLDGWGIDVLKLWPFPLETLNPEEVSSAAEDLFSVRFAELEGGAYLAHTYGLSKLGAPELTFRFEGTELIEDAALACGVLADQMLEGKQAGDTLTLGFDDLVLLPSPPLENPATFVRRMLPADAQVPERRNELRGRVPLGEALERDVTQALMRLREQRETLERFGVDGEVPHQRTNGQVEGDAGALLVAARRQAPKDDQDSGWVLTCAQGHQVRKAPLGQLVDRFPQLGRYLGLPAGTRIRWNGSQVSVDVPGVSSEALN